MATQTTPTDAAEIQFQPVSTTAPAPGQILAWVGSQWEPVDPAPRSTVVAYTLVL